MKYRDSGLAKSITFSTISIALALYRHNRMEIDRSEAGDATHSAASSKASSVGRSAHIGRFVVREELSCLGTTFSSILDITGRSDIGQKLPEFRGSPDFWVGVTTETSHASGKVSVEMEELMR